MFQGKSSAVRPKSGSSSPGKKTNMVAPMPVVTSTPATQSSMASLLPAATGGATKMGAAMLPTLLPGGGDTMSALTPSQQQMLAQYQMMLSQTTVVTNMLPTGVPALNFGIPQLNFGVPQSQLLSSTTLLCNTMPTNSHLGAPPLTSFDPSVLAAMPALDMTTAGLMGQGRGGALRRNINMMSPPGGLQKRNTFE